jgi:hypothetical protein
MADCQTTLTRLQEVVRTIALDMNNDCETRFAAAPDQPVIVHLRIQALVC